MSGPDAEQRSRAEELAYLQQRFDIHVMAFADQSEATAHALQRAFSVDRATAQRMLEGTPVVVKRAATPEVASVLLDELNRIGAQVVLLPSDTKGSLPPPSGEPSRAAAAPARTAPAAASAHAKPSAWGALDLPSAPPPRPNTPFSSQSRSSAALAGDALEESLDESADAGHAPGESEPAPDTDAELHLHSSAPPAIVRRSPPPRRSSEEIDLEGDDDPLQISRLSVPAPRRVSPPPPRASAPPRAPRTPKPAPPPPPAAPPPPPEPRRSLRAPDLGLGTVPPLPSLSPRKPLDEFLPLPPSPMPAPPLSVAPHAARGRPARPAAPPPRAAAQAEPHLPSVPRGAETRRMARPQGQQAKTRAGAEPTRSGAKRAAKGEPKPDAQRPPTGPVRTAFERDPFPGPALSGPRGEFPVPPQPGAAPSPAVPATDARRAASPSPAKPEEPPARGLAVVLLFGSMLGLGLGIYVGDSVLQGMASPLSIALHGVALYGFGAGIAGLRS